MQLIFVAPAPAAAVVVVVEERAASFELVVAGGCLGFVGGCLEVVGVSEGSAGSAERLL